MIGLHLNTFTMAAQRRWWRIPAYSIAAFDGGDLGAGLAADFRRGRYALPMSMTPAQILAATPAEIGAAMRACAFSDMFEFSRLSTAMGTVGGQFVTFPEGQPRLEDDGLLLEGPSTNYVRNAVMAGASVGVVGAGGAVPTNMSMSAAVGGDLMTTVVGTGVERGLPYVDLRFQGQNTTARYLNIEAQTQIPAVMGDTRTFSCYVRLVGGSVQNISDLQLSWAERNSGGGNATGNPSTTTNILPTIGSAERRSLTRTMTAADCAYMLPFIRLPVAPGPIDLTLRITMPQAEPGAYPTSPILTTGVSAARVADSCKLSARAAALLQRASAGLLVQGGRLARASAAAGQIMGGPGSARVCGTSSGGAPTIGDAQTLTVGNAPSEPWPDYGFAASWNSGGKAGAIYGQLATNAVPMDSNRTSIYLGRSQSITSTNGYYHQLVAWPARPANAALLGKAVSYV